MARSTVATSTLASAGRSAFVRLTWRSTRGSLKTLRLADRQEGPGRTASCSLAKIDHVILREEQDQLVLVRQVDHSMLSGWLAACWGAGPWERPQPYSSCVVGARMHDVIWVTWDESLPCGPDGRPYNFRDVSRRVILPYQERGIDAVEALDPYAGLLTSLHFSGFYHSHWGWQAGSVDEDDREAVDAHVRHELDRQRRIRDRIGIDLVAERRLECNYKWLQMWDRISRD